MQEWGIHWFRRDLRVVDNLALRENWKRTQGHTLGLFCFDSKFLSRADFSHNRFAFFINTLKSLRDDWRQQGGDLLVVDGQAKEVFDKIFSYCKDKKIKLPSLVSWSRDYEPFARQRDEKVETFLKKNRSGHVS